MKKIIVIALAVGCFINNNAMLSRFGRQSKVIEAGQKKIERTKSPKKDVIRMYSAGQQDKKSSGKQDEDFRKKYREHTTGVRQESKWSMPGWKPIAAVFAAITTWWYGTKNSDIKWIEVDEFRKNSKEIFYDEFYIKSNKSFVLEEEDTEKVDGLLRVPNVEDGTIFTFEKIPANFSIIFYKDESSGLNHLILLENRDDKLFQIMNEYYANYPGTKMYIISRLKYQGVLASNFAPIFRNYSDLTSKAKNNIMNNTQKLLVPDYPFRVELEVINGGIEVKSAVRMSNKDIRQMIFEEPIW